MKKARKICILRAFSHELNLICRPPCTIFELIYNGPKAIGKHCCLIINALGILFFNKYLNENGKYEN